MPLYFAYGSNMDLQAMRARCPRAHLLGPARLAGHRFALMGRSGYATVRREPRSTVYGLLFRLAPSDVGPLDRYEDVASGLYAKAILPVIPVDGVGTRRALVYLGLDKADGGTPPPGYMEAVLDAGRVAALPPAYLAVLDGHRPRGPLREAARWG